MSIDGGIASRMNQFRGNPQALMQRYQQTRELLDLLALQKLKSEKEAAARQMSLAMATSPQTIKQQREAELMDMTKRELAQRVGDVARQQQARRQQNLERLANSGIASVSGPAPRMAEGGIVSFAGGDYVNGMSTDIDALIRQATSKYGRLPFELLRAVIQQESGGNPQATSGAGARGLMQIVPTTARGLGVENPDDLYDPAVNIDTGARYLNQLLERFDGDVFAALTAYHSGPTRVARLRAELGDDYISALGPVGQQYAQQVLGRITPAPVEPAPVDPTSIGPTLAASVARMDGPGVRTTITPEPHPDGARRQNYDSPAVGELDSLREAITGPDRRREMVANTERPGFLEGMREVLFGGDVREGVVPKISNAVRTGAPGGIFDLLALLAGGSGQSPSRVPQSSLEEIDAMLKGLRAPQQQTQTGGSGRVVSYQRADLPNIREVTPPTIGTEGIEALRPSTTPEQARDDAFEGTMDKLGIEGLRESAQDRIRRLAELDAQQARASAPDAREQRLDRLSAFLRGAAGRSTFGMTGAGASAGAAGVRGQQQAQERARQDQIRANMRERLGMEASADEQLLEGRKSAVSSATKAYEQGSIDRRTYASLLQNNATQAAKDALDAQLGNQRADIARYKAEAERMVEEIRSGTGNREDILKQYVEIEKVLVDAEKAAMDAVEPALIGIEDPEERAAVITEVRSGLDEATSGLYTAAQVLRAQLFGG